MRKSISNHQGGASFIGFLLALVLVGCVAYVGVRLFPMYQDYYIIKKSAQSLAKQPSAAEMGRAALKELFFRRLDINFSNRLVADDVTLTKVNNGWLMQVQYEARTPLIGNLDVVGHFEVAQEIKKDAGGK